MKGIKKGVALKPSDLVPMKAGHTISKMLAKNFILFSLAANTDISAESYLEDKSYMVIDGTCDVAGIRLGKGEIAVIERGTLLGLESAEGAYLLEGTWEGENEMKLEKGKPISLKDQIEYVEGGIANVDIAKRPGMKFGLLAFDEGQGLTPHSAPGDALVIALEGRAHLTMGDIAVDVEAGDQIVFEKNIPHSVTALTPFKMALLMVVED